MSEIDEIKKRGRPRLSLEEKQRRKEERAAMSPAERMAASMEYGASKRLPQSAVLSEGDGDNARFINHMMAVISLPRIDLNDPEAVNTQLCDYLRLCQINDIKPNVVGMAQALHVQRQQLWSVVNNQPYNKDGTVYRVSTECTNLLKEWYFGL